MTGQSRQSNLSITVVLCCSLCFGNKVLIGWCMDAGNSVVSSEYAQPVGIFRKALLLLSHGREAHAKHCSLVTRAGWILQNHLGASPLEWCPFNLQTLYWHQPSWKADFKVTRASSSRNKVWLIWLITTEWHRVNSEYSQLALTGKWSTQTSCFYP